VRDSRKPIVTFSDGCVLLNAITAKTGLITFHGPNVAGKLDESNHASLDLLRGRNVDKGEFPAFGNSARAFWECWREGQATGRLYGGNLSTFVLGLVGTRFLDISDSVIFFWENVGDSPQIIHQYLTCLVNAGWFDRVAGMVVGDLIINPLPEGSEWKRRSAQAAVLQALAGFNFPIAHCPTFGHRSLENPIVPIGATCVLDTDGRSATVVDRVVG
jgi:muramoyltetrapeptide carboxypeptidase